MLQAKHVPSPFGEFIHLVDDDTGYEACRVYPMAYESDGQTLARAQALATVIELGWVQYLKGGAE